MTSWRRARSWALMVLARPRPDPSTRRRLGEFEFAALPVGEDGVSGGPVGFDAEEAVEALGFVVVTDVVDVRDDFGEGLGEVGVEEVCGGGGAVVAGGGFDVGSDAG